MYEKIYYWLTTLKKSYLPVLNLTLLGAADSAILSIKIKPAAT